MKEEIPLTIRNKNNEEIARFEINGDVYLKSRKIDVDKELAQLFSLCILEMAGISAEKLLKKIRG